MAAAVITPAKPNGMNGRQFAGSTYQAASAMKSTITASLMIDDDEVDARALLDAAHQQPGQESDDQRPPAG